jgi:hypothetical protein
MKAHVRDHHGVDPEADDDAVLDIVDNAPARCPSPLSQDVLEVKSSRSDFTQARWTQSIDGKSPRFEAKDSRCRSMPSSVDPSQSWCS